MDETIQKDINDRMAQLPQVVQDAISSADTTAHLRELSERHKLHLDQWEILQVQVMLTLLGFQEVEELPQNIEKNVGVTREIAEEVIKAGWPRMPSCMADDDYAEIAWWMADR